VTADVSDILNRCEQTASWAGLVVADLRQRNTLGDTALHTVCTWGEVEPVRRLIAAGANVNALGDRGCTPLFNAVTGRNPAVIRALIDAGADPRTPSKDGWLVLGYARNVRASTAVIDAIASSPLLGQGG
jgi:uncharacterized protein